MPDIAILGAYHGVGLERAIVCGSSKQIAAYALEHGFDKAECPPAVQVDIQHQGLMRYYDSRLPNMNITMPLALFNEDIVAILSKKI